MAAVLALCILAYDAGLKHTWLGPVFMGACRGLNLLLGMSHAPALGGPIAWFAAVAYGLYVAGITVVSRSETSGGNRGGLVAGLALQDLALLGLAGVALCPSPLPAPDPDRPLIPLEGLLVLALVALAVNSPPPRAIRAADPQLIQKTVKTGILSPGLAPRRRGRRCTGPGTGRAASRSFWVPAYLLGRWLYST